MLSRVEGAVVETILVWDCGNVWVRLEGFRLRASEPSIATHLFFYLHLRMDPIACAFVITSG